VISDAEVRASTKYLSIKRSPARGLGFFGQLAIGGDAALELGFALGERGALPFEILHRAAERTESRHGRPEIGGQQDADDGAHHEARIVPRFRQALARQINSHGRNPSRAAHRPVWKAGYRGEERDEGVPRGPGGPLHSYSFWA
jgi:hypothetical protein